MAPRSPSRSGWRVPQWNKEVAGGVQAARSLQTATGMARPPPPASSPPSIALHLGPSFRVRLSGCGTPRSSLEQHGGKRKSSTTAATTATTDIPPQPPILPPLPLSPRRSPRRCQRGRGRQVEGWADEELLGLRPRPPLFPHPDRPANTPSPRPIMIISCYYYYYYHCCY